MKKIYFLFSALFITSLSFGQNLIITGAYDGPLSGGTPKGVELYVVNDIADLSAYGIGSANNGGGTDGEEYTLPADSATKGDFIYIATEIPNFTTWFGFAPDYNGGSAVSINGDDAIELFHNGSVIDVFGDINVDGTGQPWEHLDGWAYRNADTGPDGATFVLGSWSFSGPNALDGETTNGTAATPFPTGTFTTTLSTKENQIDGFDLYPNPTKEAFVSISSDKQSPMKVSVYDILGKQVIERTITNNRLNISNLNTGVYILRAQQDNAFTTRKLIIN